MLLAKLHDAQIYIPNLFHINVMGNGECTAQCKVRKTSEIFLRPPEDYLVCGTTMFDIITGKQIADN